MHARFRMGIALAMAGTLLALFAGATLAKRPTPHRARPASRVTRPVRKLTLTETGSTLLYPLFNLWAPVYMHAHPGVRIDTQATGSGTGISDAANGTVVIGASDAYLSPGLAAENPNLLNIPLAISAQAIVYNLPGVHGHLRLSGPVLAAIYQGKVQYWNDRAIERLNPGVRLPHLAIVPVRRNDGSGDTFLFTQYLSDTTRAWALRVGYNTSVSWPSVRREIGAVGNAGVLQAVAQVKGGLGYLGISYLDEATRHGLGVAAIENRAGRFVLPSSASIEAAANALSGKTPANERISLVFAPGGNAYPIINYEYAIVNRALQDTNTAKALRQFLDWAISPQGGNAMRFLEKVHFEPLPAKVRTLSLHQIAEIR